MPTLILLVLTRAAPAQRQLGTAAASRAEGVITKSDQFKYLDHRARGQAPMQLAAVQLDLPAEMEVHIRATTSAMTLGQGTTNFSMGFSDALPVDIKRPPWGESGRFVTIPAARQWVFCGTSYVRRLPAGRHTIYWWVGDVVGAEVLFDAGSMSVQAFPLVATSPGGSRGDRRALLVGINEYLSPSVSDLEGCVNDVDDMYRLLTSRFGFAASDIRVLKDNNATHDNIISTIQEHLIGGATENSLVVFYYSGHGSQARDERGGDEQDGWDETLVPYDSRTPGVWDITDDEIHGLLTALSAKTRNVAFIFDSCHSGTAVKALGAVARRTDNDRRDPPPAPDYARGVEGIVGNRELNYVLISGCRADELSFEYTTETGRRGTLTYFLTEEIRRSRASGVSYAQIMDVVKAKVNAVYRSQHPQIEGANMGDPIFGIRAVAAPPFVLATQIGKRVALSAGRAHGLTVGSLFDVYPPQTTDFSSLAGAIARIKISSADVFESQATFVWGGPLDRPSPAVERGHAQATGRFPVFVDLAGTLYEDAVPASETLLRIQQELANEIPFKTSIELTRRSSDARLQLAQNKDGQIELLDGSQLLDAKPASAPDAVTSVTQKVVHWAKWLEVLFLENPSSSLAVEFHLRPLAGPREKLLETRGQAQFRFRHGDEFELSVKNASRQELYITLLNLSSDGSIEIVFPQQGDGRIGSGRTETLRMRALVQKEDEVVEQIEEVKDVIKLIATTQPSDFSVLELDAAPKGDSLAARLMGRALLQPRGASETVDPRDWTTELVVFDVVP